MAGRRVWLHTVKGCTQAQRTNQREQSDAAPFGERELAQRRFVR